MIDYGQCAVVGQELLRLHLDETIELVRSRFGDRLDHDAAARLHDLTEGWPLGLQLALSAIDRGGDARNAAAAPGAQGDALRGHFVDLLLANLDPADVAFLTRIAMLDHLHADLCSALAPSTTGPSAWRAWRATRRSSLWPKA